MNRQCTSCAYLNNCDEAFIGDSCNDYKEAEGFVEADRVKQQMEFQKTLTKMIKRGADQNAKSDAGKAKLSLVPTDLIWAIAAIREYGNNKYPEGGPDNWKSVERERYIDACYRHWLRFVDNPTGVDKESGLPHLWHVACNVAFLCEMYGPELRRKC